MKTRKLPIAALVGALTLAGSVHLLDLLGAGGPCPGCAADLNGDGVVSVVDLLELLGPVTSPTAP